MTEGLIVQIIITVGGITVAALVGLFALRKTRGEASKAEADAAAVIQATSLGLLAPLREQVAELKSTAEATAARAARDLRAADETTRVLTERLGQATERLDQAVALLRQHGIPLPWEEGS